MTFRQERYVGWKEGKRRKQNMGNDLFSTKRRRGGEDDFRDTSLVI